jgi:hypothetical protein
VGGGGGWEGKTGRLALDINSQIETDSGGDRTTFMSLNESDADGPPILQNGLVSPGAYVQFLTSPRPGPAEDPFGTGAELKKEQRGQMLFTRDLEMDADHPPSLSGISFGKVTDLSHEAKPDPYRPGDPRAVDWDPLDHGIKGTVGHFGPMSLAGVSVRSVSCSDSSSEPGGTQLRTRVDSPHSGVQVSCRDVRVRMDLYRQAVFGEVVVEESELIDMQQRQERQIHPTPRPRGRRASESSS